MAAQGLVIRGASSLLLGAVWEPTPAPSILQSKKGKEMTASTADAVPGTPEPPSSVCSQIRGSLPPASAEHGAVLASSRCPASGQGTSPQSEQQGTHLEMELQGKLLAEQVFQLPPQDGGCGRGAGQPEKTPEAR